MTQSIRRKAAKQVVMDMLKAGQTVTPKALAEQAKLSVSEHTAYHCWLVNYCRSLTHEVAKELDVVVMSLGNGRGYKVPETPEEWQEVERRSEVQIKSHARRRKLTRKERLMVNQRVFGFLQEVTPDASGATADHQPTAAPSKSA